MILDYCERAIGYAQYKKLDDGCLRAMPISRKALIRRFKKFGFKCPYSDGRTEFMVEDVLKVKASNRPWFIRYQVLAE